jgi:hypothetical protein
VVVFAANEAKPKTQQIAPSGGGDRGGVPDLSVSGDKSDLVVVDPHDPTTTSKT